MSEFRPSDDASDRTESPSAQRLAEARRAGDLPRSGELTRWAMLATALALLAGFGAQGFEFLKGWLARQLAAVGGPLPAAPFDAALAVLWPALPLLLALLAAAIVAPLLLSGWAFSGAPRLARLDPLGVLRRLASADAGFDAVRFVCKCLIVLSVIRLAWDAGIAPVPETAAAVELPARFAAPLWQALEWLLAGLAGLAVLDAGWRWWRWWRRHAMTPREAQAEAMENEASPELRAALRRRREAAGQGGAA